MDCSVGSPALLWLTGLTYGIVLVLSRDSERVRKGGKERERVWEGLVSEPYCLPAREEEERVLSYYNLYFWSKELQISLYLSLAFSLPVSSFPPFHLTAYSLSLSLALSLSLTHSLNLAPEAISGEVLRARSVTADRFHKYNKLQCMCVCSVWVFKYAALCPFKPLKKRSYSLLSKLREHGFGHCCFEN